MNALDILRRITKPMTDKESAEMVRTQYGGGRENVSSDDLVAIERARAVFAQRVDKGSLKSVSKGATITVRTIKIKGPRGKSASIKAKTKSGIKKLRAAR